MPNFGIYTPLFEQLLSSVLEAKGVVGAIIIQVLPIFMIVWGVQIFKSAIDGREREKYELDNEIDDYLASDDADDFFAHYGPRDD